MELRTLGATGVRVSPIGLGTVKLGRDQGLRYRASIPGDHEARALLGAAMELGVNLIDTAPAYGTAEERLGRLLPGARDAWTIATKAGEWFEHGRSRFDFSPEAILSSLDRSLARLRTDRVELLLVHSDGASESRFAAMGTFDALDRAKASGRARATGVSAKTVEGAHAALERVDALMVTLNPLERELVGVIERARGLGKGVLIKKALASGRIGAGGADPVDAAVRLAAHTAGVSSVIIGTTNPGHLEQAVRACDAGPLPPGYRFGEAREERSTP